MNLWCYLIENNQGLSSRVERLTRTELRLHSQLSQTVLYHPQRTIVVKLPKKLRQIVLLFEVRQLLPTTVRIEVEEVYFKTISHLSSEQLVCCENLRRYESECNDRFLKGRGCQLLSSALDGIRILFRDPKPAKRKVRRRGYTDGKVSGSAEEHKALTVRLKVLEEALQEKKYLYQELTRSELAAAEVILARERTGESAQAISGNPTAAQQHAEEMQQMYDVATDTEEEKLSSEVISEHTQPTGSGKALMRLASRGSLGNKPNSEKS